MTEAVDQAVEAAGSSEPSQDAGGVATEGAGGAEQELPEFRPFTWKDGDKEFQFSRRAELADFLKNRSSQWSSERKRAQETAAHFEKRMKDLEAKEQALQQGYGKWSKIDEAMKGNPRVAQAIEQAFQQAMRSGGGSPDLDRILEEKLSPLQEKLSAYEKAEQQRQAQVKRQRAISRLKSQYEDADDKVLMAELNRLQEVPDDDQEYALYELLYHALKGKTTPAAIEKKFAESQSKRRPPSVTSTPGRTKGEADVTKMSRAERAEYALRQIGE
jgi:hypothetical protein